MLWPVLIVATLSSVLAAIACFALGVRNLAYVVPTQLIVSTGVTYAISARMAGYSPTDPMELFWTCVLAATFVPMMWLVLRQIVGPPPPEKPGRARGAQD